MPWQGVYETESNDSETERVSQELARRGTEWAVAFFAADDGQGRTKGKGKPDQGNAEPKGKGKPYPTPKWGQRSSAESAAWELYKKSCHKARVIRNLKFEKAEFVHREAVERAEVER